MRPVGTQSRFTTLWYAVCFLHVSTLGKYVSTLAIVVSFPNADHKRSRSPRYMHLGDQINYSCRRPARR